MYHYINDKEILGKLKVECTTIINQLVVLINNEGLLTVKASIIGPNGVDLITQNKKEAINVDYNISIIEVIDNTVNDGNSLKEYIRKRFNVLLRNNKWGNSFERGISIMTQERYLKNYFYCKFCIKLFIIKEHCSKQFILINTKNKPYDKNTWIWNEIKDSKDLKVKIKYIKDIKRWNDVREMYRFIKNLYYINVNDEYLDINHPPIMCYIEAVNKVYDKYKKEILHI